MQPGVGGAVLCSQSLDKAKLVKRAGGGGKCTHPEPAAVEAEKDDGDEEKEKLINGPAKLRAHIRKQVPPEGRKILDKMEKP